MTRHNQTCVVPGCGRSFRGFDDETGKIIVWRRIEGSLKSFSVAGPLCPKHRKMADELAGAKGMADALHHLKASAKALIKPVEQAKAGLAV